MNRVQRFVLEDGVKDLVLVVPPEGRLSEQHLVNKYSKSPPVDRAAVALFQDNLRKGQS